MKCTSKAGVSEWKRWLDHHDKLKRKQKRLLIVYLLCAQFEVGLAKS